MADLLVIDRFLCHLGFISLSHSYLWRLPLKGSHGGFYVDYRIYQGFYYSKPGKPRRELVTLEKVIELLIEFGLEKEAEVLMFNTNIF